MYADIKSKRTQIPALIGLWLLSTFAAMGQANTLYAAKEAIETIDPSLLTIEKDNEAPAKRYLMIYYARPARLYPFSFGHAFIRWIKIEQGIVVEDFTYGFYPTNDDGLKSILAKVKGSLQLGYKENTSKSKRLDSLEVEVTEEIYKSTLEEATMKDGSTYRLLSYNCLTFIDEVAQKAGLNTPRVRILGFLPKLPKSYLRQLKRKNNQHATILPPQEDVVENKQ